MQNLRHDLGQLHRLAAELLGVADERDDFADRDRPAQRPGTPDERDQGDVEVVDQTIGRLHQI